MVVGWSLDRSIRERNAALAQLHSCLSIAYHGSMLSVDEAGMVADRVFAPLARAPEHVRAYIRGAYHALREVRYHREIVWAHRNPDDGALYSLHVAANPAHFRDIRPLYDDGYGWAISHWGGGHYWNHSGKPYFVSEAE